MQRCVNMSQKRLLRICPVCGKPDLKYLPEHLIQVHNISNPEDRKRLLKTALYSQAQLYAEHSTLLCNNEKTIPNKTEQDSFHAKKNQLRKTSFPDNVVRTKQKRDPPVKLLQCYK